MCADVLPALFVTVVMLCPAAIEEHLLNTNVSSIKLNTYVDSGGVPLK